MSVQQVNLKAIADAIREKEGTSDSIDAVEFADRIRAISTSGLPEDVYTIKVESNDENGGTVSGGGYASAGMELTVKANINDGYNFSSWQVDGEIVSENKDYTFNVDTSKNLVAIFEKSGLLPTGYTEVEYIENSSALNTSVHSGFLLFEQENFDLSKLVIKIKGKCSNYGTGSSRNHYRYLYMIYDKDKTTGNSYQTCLDTILFSSGDNFEYYNLGTRSYGTFSGINGNVIEIALNFKDGTLSFGNYTKTFNTLNLQIPFTFLLGTSLNKSLYCGISEIFYVTVEEDGELLHDYRPCISPDAVCGLYDIVTNQFKSDYCDATWTAGPSIS